MKVAITKLIIDMVLYGENSVYVYHLWQLVGLYSGYTGLSMNGVQSHSHTPTHMPEFI